MSVQQHSTLRSRNLPAIAASFYISHRRTGKTRKMRMNNDLWPTTPSRAPEDACAHRYAGLDHVRHSHLGRQSTTGLQISAATALRKSQDNQVYSIHENLILSVHHHAHLHLPLPQHTPSYSSGRYTASRHNTTTFLNNRLHSNGSPEAFTNSTSINPSPVASKMIDPDN